MNIKISFLLFKSHIWSKKIARLSRTIRIFSEKLIAIIFLLIPLQIFNRFQIFAFLKLNLLFLFLIKLFEQILLFLKVVTWCHFICTFWNILSCVWSYPWRSVLYWSLSILDLTQLKGWFWTIRVINSYSLRTLVDPFLVPCRFDTISLTFVLTLGYDSLIHEPSLNNFLFKLNRQFCFLNQFILNHFCILRFGFEFSFLINCSNLVLSFCQVKLE